MKSLHNRVNIVPVIAKADTLTKAEINRLKKRVLEEIAKNSIKIYQLPEVEEDEEEDYKEQTRVLKVKISENRLSSKYWIPRLFRNLDFRKKIRIEYDILSWKNSLKLLYQMVVAIGDNDMANFEIKRRNLSEY